MLVCSICKQKTTKKGRGGVSKKCEEKGREKKKEEREKEENLMFCLFCVILITHQARVLLLIKPVMGALPPFPGPGLPFLPNYNIRNTEYTM